MLSHMRNNDDDYDYDGDDEGFLSAGLQQHQLHPECISAAASRPADLSHPEPTLPTHNRACSRDTALTQTHTQTHAALALVLLLYSE